MAKRKNERDVDIDSPSYECPDRRNTGFGISVPTMLWKISSLFTSMVVPASIRGLFAAIAATRTLTTGTIKRIKQMGFAVKVEGSEERYL